MDPCATAPGGRCRQLVAVEDELGRSHWHTEVAIAVTPLLVGVVPGFADLAVVVGDVVTCWIALDDAVRAGYGRAVASYVGVARFAGDYVDAVGWSAEVGVDRSAWAAVELRAVWEAHLVEVQRRNEVCEAPAAVWLARFPLPRPVTGPGRWGAGPAS